MKKLMFNLDKENINKAEKIIKIDNKITGYNGINKVFEFTGITDFNLFKLTDESDNPVDYDIDDSNVQIQTVANVILQNATLQEQMQNLANTVAKLMLGGGTSA